MEDSKKGKPINQGKDFAYRRVRARLPPNMELVCGGGNLRRWQFVVVVCGGGNLWWW